MEHRTAEGKLAEKLARALASIEDEEPYVFTSKEVEKIQALIAFVDKLIALKWFGKWVLWLVIAAGSIIVNWERIISFFDGGQS